MKIGKFFEKRLNWENFPQHTFFARVILSCVCVSGGVFVPLNEIVLYCIDV